MLEALALIKMRIKLTKQEVEDLKKFCDSNLERGIVVIDQILISNKPITRVGVSELPETLTDITDINYWSYEH